MAFRRRYEEYTTGNLARDFVISLTLFAGFSLIMKHSESTASRDETRVSRMPVAAYTSPPVQASDGDALYLKLDTKGLFSELRRLDDLDIAEAEPEESGPSK